MNQEPTTKNLLLKRLRTLGEGMGSPESVLRASQAAGYSVEEIDQIVSWYERQARTDGKGKTWWPYTLGQLATRLKDEQARLDGCTPAQGRWAGGKCGIWASLGSEGPGGAQPGRSGRDTGMVVPTIEQAAKLALRERVRGLLHQQGVILLTNTAQNAGPLQERAQKALLWVEAGNWTKGAFETPRELWELLAEILSVSAALRETQTSSRGAAEAQR